jgi:hypothetical protein
MALDAPRCIGQKAGDRINAKGAPPMLDFLKRLVTWWNGQTLGTQIFTARKGVKVGEDDQGNTSIALAMASGAG